VSDFFGLRVALSSLYAQRRGLEVTGHNVANVNTEGYSRQRVGLQAAGASTVPALHARWEGAGAGVDVTGVDRLRDQFLESRALVEHSVDSRLRQSQQVMARSELVFAEPGPNGLQAELAEFWAGWGDIANQPTDLAARSQILERSKTLATSFNRTRDELGTLWGASAEQLKVTVDDVNATAARVAELNAAIERATKSDLSPNDLADQRDLLALKLAQSVGATVRPGEAGVVDVYLGGTALVRGSRAETLQVSVPDGTSVANADQKGQAVQIQWAKDGYPAMVSGGRAGGLLDGLNRVLPATRAGIDQIAKSVADVVNAQQAQGYDLGGTEGGPLFGWDTPPRTGLTVQISDPARIAAAAEPPNGGPSVDGRNALRMGDLAAKPTGPDQAYRSFIVALGVETQAINRQVDIQANITGQVDAVRDAESGVNLDEEMANMVAYQHAYSAASRLLTAVDEMLETLIRGTGVVGR
jgi:flagellar hook-associated protein FlgK